MALLILNDPGTDTGTQTLLANANCYRCYGVNGIAQVLKLGLLVEIATALNPMADTSPNALLASAKCYNCNSNADIGMLLELGLLKIIADNIGSAGGGAPDYINYAGPPVVNPPALQNIVVDVNGVQWQFFNNQWN